MIKNNQPLYILILHGMGNKKYWLDSTADNELMFFVMIKIIIT